jgi:predicted secreted protein
MVNGSTLFLYVGLDKVAKTKGYSLDVTMDQLPTTSNTSGFFRDQISKIGAWSISSDSLLVFDGFSYGYLYDLYLNRTKVFLSVGDEDGQSFLGSAFIESINSNGSLESVAAISVSFKGVGQLSISNVTGDRFIIDELFEVIIDQDGNNLVYT